LAGARQEVDEIAKRYPSDEVRVYLQQEATEENVKDNRLVHSAKWIHFAAHGIFDPEKPEYSGLVLAQTPSSSEDGFLQVFEIFNLEMNADLVVLSACQTGLGTEVTGEGLVGLTRAFLYAGTTSIVVSLWVVADSSASELMPRFYQNLDQGSDKAEALRLAKLAMIHEGGKFSRPYYWAPFILVGKTR
jgi:CHAT domain-containing protein